VRLITGGNIQNVSAAGITVWRTTATSASGALILQAIGTTSAVIESVSVKEVIALTTSSNDYFQLTTDGKFYRLWKNLFAQTNSLNSSPWVSQGMAAPVSTVDGKFKLIPDNTLVSPGALFWGLPIGTSLNNAGPRTFSVDVYPSGYNFAVVGLFDRPNLYNLCSIDLTTGAVVETNNPNNPASAQISTTPISGGYRVTFVFAASSVLDTSAWVGVAPHNNGDFYTGTATLTSWTPDGVSGIEIARPQLEFGSVATAYEAKGAEGSTSEVFRGNKRKFPKLAGIVAEAASVTIYDLTEAGRPMWMRFVQGNNLVGIYSGFGAPITAVGISAVNGLLAVAHGSNFMGTTVVDFGKDSARRHREGLTANGSSGYWRGNLANRNNAGLTYDGTTPGSIVNSTVNAVAMTVLPDAPVDPVTGLKVPTIDVFTSSGWSRIRSNGTVDSSFAGSSNRFGVRPNARGYMLTMREAYGSFGVMSVAGENRWAMTQGSSYLIGLRDTRYNVNLWSDGAGATPIPKTALFLNQGVNLFSPCYSKITNSVMAGITNTFNTGHLVGDIRRAYLADVGVGSVSGPELVTNGTFDTDTGWTKTANATISGGVATINVPAVAESSLSQSYAGQVGVPYLVTATVTMLATPPAAAAVGINIGGTGQDLWISSQNSLVSGQTYQIRGVGTLTSATSFFLRVGQAFGQNYAMNFTIDNVSVRRAIPDRSYKAKGADITGTLTKSQVASAAQLVAYSGFSAANYLREPYSADLDFGTGEWSASAWVNVPVAIPVSGVELVTNGTFTSDTVGWTGVNTDISAAGGELVVTSNAASATQYAEQVLTVVVGKTYRVSAVLRGGTSTPRLRVGTSAAGPQYGALTSTGSVTFVATSASLYLSPLNGNSTVGTTSYYDDISVQEVPAMVIADRAHSSGAKVTLGFIGTGQLQATAFDGTTTRTVTTTAAYNTATWLKARANYTTDGTLAISVNGVEVAATRGNPLLTLNNSNAVLTIGNSFALDAPFPGSIALLKASATVPTAEQMVWIYEQEKQMFRDGAQVTLPDAGSIVDLTYDDLTDKWIAVSATNESEFSGLIRTSVTPSPAGSYTKVTAASGVQLLARSTTSPGVDITAPAQNLREELLKDAEAAARMNAQLAVFDYVGGFTATTVTGNTAITSVASLTYPVSYIGARVSGSGIPADTFVAAVVGTTVYLTKAATASASAVAISFSDFILPTGMEAKEVSLAGVAQREGATAQFTRLFDGFKETIRFGTAPSNTALIQIQAARSAA
jgi:hypothetical protein